MSLRSLRRSRPTRLAALLLTACLSASPSFAGPTRRGAARRALPAPTAAVEVAASTERPEPGIGTAGRLSELTDRLNTEAAEPADAAAALDGFFCAAAPRFVPGGRAPRDEAGGRAARGPDLGIGLRYLGLKYFGSHGPDRALTPLSRKFGRLIDPPVPPSAAPNDKTAGGPRSLAGLFSRLDEIGLTGGMEALIAWRKAKDPEAAAKFKEMSIRETGDAEFPLELRMSGRTVARMKGPIGEGNHAAAYLTDRGTVLKVVKRASGARGLLMAAWVGPIAKAYGIDTAEVHRVEPSGLYMEQEYIPGPSLEGTLKSWKRDSAEGRRIADTWKNARKLSKERGIWPDLKAANFQTRPDGRIALVDLTPTLYNYYDYYLLSKLRPLLGPKGFWKAFNHVFTEPAGPQEALPSPGTFHPN